MAWTRIQTGARTALPSGQTTTFTTTCHLTSNAVVGNQGLVLISFWSQNASTTPSIVSVSDAQNGAWTQLGIVTFTDGAFKALGALYLRPVTVRLLSTDLVSVQLNPGTSSTNTGGDLYAIEYSGLDTSGSPVDVTSNANAGGGTSTAPATANVTPNATGELILRAYFDDGWTVAWSAAPNGTAVVNQMSDATDDLWLSEGVSTSGSAETTSGTLAGATAWGMLVVVVKLAAVAQIGAAAAQPVGFQQTGPYSLRAMTNWQAFPTPQPAANPSGTITYGYGPN